ncbi:MAG: sulfur carrier protein ThiS [Pseudomonadota bacterium]
MNDASRKTNPPAAPNELTITVNGEATALPRAVSIRGVLEHLGLAEGKVAVERNREIVPRSQFDEMFVENGDALEIVRFVGGG